MYWAPDAWVLRFAQDDSLDLCHELLGRHTRNYNHKQATSIFLLLGRNSQTLHLTVEVASLQPQRFRSAADVAMIFIQFL